MRRKRRWAILYKVGEKNQANPSWAHLYLGFVYAKAGQPQEAKEQFQTAINLSPELDRLYFYYAEFLKNQQEIERRPASLQGFGGKNLG